MNIHHIPCKIVQRKGKRSAIEVEGQCIEVPSEVLPQKASDGEILQLYFYSEKDAKIKEENLAKMILEEILNGK